MGRTPHADKIYMYGCYYILLHKTARTKKNKPSNVTQFDFVFNRVVCGFFKVYTIILFRFRVFIYFNRINVQILIWLIFGSDFRNLEFSPIGFDFWFYKWVWLVFDLLLFFGKYQCLF